MKAILVIDMPINCECCRFRISDLNGENWECYGDETIRLVKDSKTKPNWCPLRPLPKKLDYRDLSDEVSASIEWITEE